MRKMLWMLAFFFCSMIVWPTMTEAKPDRVEVSQEGSGASAVVKLKWKFQAGDKLYRTFNGDQWSEVPFTEPTAGADVEVSDNNGGAGFPKGSNVYYEVRDAGYNGMPGTKRDSTVQSHFKRITVFIDSGNATTEYAHGNYTNNTNACASCHVNHKGKSAAKQLLTQPSVHALCETCHAVGGGGTGSKYVTDYGAVKDKDGNFNPSPAGPITTATETEYGTPVPDTQEFKDRGLGAATSTHAFTGNHEAAGDRLNIDKNGNLLPTRAMECTSCHQAHPNDNNYRLLKSVNSYMKAVDGTVTAPLSPVIVEAYAVNDGTKETVRYKSGSTQFCEQCHKVFHNTNDANTSPTGGGSQTQVTYNGETFFLHPSEKAMNLHGKLLTSDLPLQNVKDLAAGDSPNNITLTNNKTKDSYITCITCHYSHGTSKSGEVASNFIPTLPKSTMLKRTDNYGMCEECHKK